MRESLESEGPESAAVPRSVLVFLLVGLAAASQSGNLIRLADANPIAVAAWRLLLAAAVLAPFAGRDLLLLRTLCRTERILLPLAGLALAAHFFAWIAAVQMTTVANAAVFFAVNPVITAAAEYFLFGQKADRHLKISMILGLAGVAVMGGGDLTFHRGDLAVRSAIEAEYKPFHDAKTLA